MATVNVILHGLFVMERSETGLLALAPDLGREHVFRAGSWLGETELRRGRYSLRGAATGNGEFDPARNLHVDHRKLVPDAENRAYASISFPKPREIRSLRAIAMNRDQDFAGADKDRLQIDALSTVQILIFDCARLGDVRLEGHDWEAPNVADGIANLHIFSEEDAVTSTGHGLRGFDAAVALFDQLDLSLITEKRVPDFDRQRDGIPEGVVPLELSDYVDQQDRLKDLGDVLRPLLSTPNPDFGQLREVWADAIPTGSKIAACSFMIARSRT